MRALQTALLAIALLLAPAAFAVTPGERLDDPVLEERARDLSTGLRCMVCQNQSIDDSDAPLAQDLRILVRERLVAGDTDREVIDFVVARYGEYVLMKPRFGASTLILWLAAPLLFAGTAIGLIMIAMRRRSGAVTGGVAALSPEEEARINALLDKDQN